MVDIANVAQDHEGSGVSLSIVVIGSCRHFERAGTGRLWEVKDSPRAQCNLYRMRGGRCMFPKSMSRMDQ